MWVGPVYSVFHDCLDYAILICYNSTSMQLDHSAVVKN